MGRRDTRHPDGRGGRLLFWVPVVLVLALLGGAGAAYWLDPGRTPDPDPQDQPAEVAPPAGLDLPELAAPSPVAAPADGVAAPAKVRRAVAPLLRDADLGDQVVAAVVGADGEVLYRSGGGAAIPASTLKLLTGSAALATMPADRTFATTVVSTAPRRIVLVGGGDPLLASSKPAAAAYPRPADVVTLARETARRLRDEGVPQVRLGYDTTLFAGPTSSPRWEPGYVPDVVAPIVPLWVDEGRPASGYGHVADPALRAAEVYAAALRRAGVRVVGEPAETAAPADATELARVESPPLWQLVEHTLLVSDNAAAEVLARQVAIATGASASFRGGASAVLDAVADLGVPLAGATAYDGSGLSRADRLRPETLVALLAVAGSAEHPELRPVLSGLPVAAFTGSLDGRFTAEVADAAGRGTVRAKTGTLSGVSGLAGVLTDRSGAPMYFAFLADDIALPDTLDARATLDAAASALAGCRCAG